MIELIICYILLFASLLTGNIELIIASGIFAIAGNINIKEIK